MKPFQFLTSEDQFLHELALLVLKHCHVPEDGAWHRVQLTFDVHGGDAKKGPSIDGPTFLLGGGNAG